MEVAPKNLHLTGRNSGSNIAQQQVDGYAFFHVHCSTKSQENLKVFNSQVSYQKKMCMFYRSSGIIFLNLRVTDQCQIGPTRHNI